MEKRGYFTHDKDTVKVESDRKKEGRDTKVGMRARVTQFKE